MNDRRETIVIGASREQKLCSLVLEHTIRKHAGTDGDDVRIIHTWDMKFPVPKDEKNKSRTGFSFNRFAIPELCCYLGSGLYLECDQIVFDDPRKLFKLGFDGALILRPKNQTSVLVLDCEKLPWKVKDIVRGLDEGKYSYHALMEEMCLVRKEEISCRVPPEWNVLDWYNIGKTKLLHYTNMAMQPWRKWGHPLTAMWIGELVDALKHSRISIQIISEEIKLKHVVPQVLTEVEKWLSP